MSSENELARWHSMLGNPLRLKMIKVLGEKGPLSFKELRKELGAGVGTIYYHLGIVSDLVERDERKRYRLSELGTRFFIALRDGTLPRMTVGPTFAERALKALLLSPLMKVACEDARVGAPLAVTILLLGAVGCSRAGLLPVILLYVRASVAMPLELFLHYLSQRLLVFLICEGLSILFLKRVGGECQLLIGLVTASIPVALFPYIYMAFPYEFSYMVLPFIHIWSVLLVCSAISLGKGVRLERSLQMGLALMSINVLLLFFMGMVMF